MQTPFRILSENSLPRSRVTMRAPVFTVDEQKTQSLAAIAQKIAPLDRLIVFDWRGRSWNEIYKLKYETRIQTNNSLFLFVSPSEYNIDELNHKFIKFLNYDFSLKMKFKILWRLSKGSNPHFLPPVMSTRSHTSIAELSTQRFVFRI